MRDTDLSHDALSLRMGHAGLDDNARYVSSSGKWYFWNEVRWEPDNTQIFLSNTRDFLRVEARTLIINAFKEATGLEKTAAINLRKWAKNKAKTLKNSATIRAVASLTQANWATAVKPDNFDQDIFLLGTPEGTVDLQTGDLRDARREEMITKLTVCGPAERGAQPVLWLKFLERMFDGDQEVIDFMQRVAGYSLTGMNTEYKFLFLHGGGRNGKSAFLETLKWILGDYACPASSSLLLASGQNQHPTALAGLKGARLVIGSEIPKNATWNEAIIKDLTGGKTLSARYMRGDFFDFKPQSTLIVAGNEKPRLKGVDQAMRAKMVLVPFNVHIPPEERDPYLAAKLQAEGPDILRWAVDGALLWQERGLDVPASIKSASLAYLDDEDVLKTFFDEETVSAPTSSVKTQVLYDRFCDWSQRQGIQAVSKKSFKHELTAHGWSETRRSSGKVILGLSLT